eukprot:852052-Rhodomonas_salina.2
MLIARRVHHADWLAVFHISGNALRTECDVEMPAKGRARAALRWPSSREILGRECAVKTHQRGVYPGTGEYFHVISNFGILFAIPLSTFHPTGSCFNFRN